MRLPDPVQAAMSEIEQLLTEIVRPPDVVEVPCFPKVSVGDGAQLAILPVSPAFGQRIIVGLLAPWGTTAILKLFVAFCVGELASATATVNDDVPGAVGVPLITPALLTANPDGKDPTLNDHM
jgi:hypothetical protein